MEDGKLRKIQLRTRTFQDGDTHSAPNAAEIDSGPNAIHTAISETLTAELVKTDSLACDLACPTLFGLCYYPLRMVAMEWMTYSELIYHSIKHYEYSPESITATMERIEVLLADLYALQQWIRRGMATSEKLRPVIQFLKSITVGGGDKDQAALLLEDYEQLASNIDAYTRHWEAMVAIKTSLIQAIDCRRSVTQTAKISRLTYLTLGFIPLTLTSGIFSMNEATAPGGRMFWLYYAVAIPLCVLVYMFVRPPTRFLERIWSRIWKSRKGHKDMV